MPCTTSVIPKACAVVGVCPAGGDSVSAAPAISSRILPYVGEFGFSPPEVRLKILQTYRNLLFLTPKKSENAEVLNGLLLIISIAKLSASTSLDRIRLMFCCIEMPNPV